MAARNRAVEKWVTNNNGSGGGAESGKSGSRGGNQAKPRRLSHIDDEKSLGFAASSANAAAPEVKVKAKSGTTAAPAPRVTRVASDAAGSSSGSIKGKVSCLQGCSSLLVRTFG